MRRRLFQSQCFTDSYHCHVTVDIFAGTVCIWPRFRAKLIFAVRFISKPFTQSICYLKTGAISEAKRKLKLASCGKVVKAAILHNVPGAKMWKIRCVNWNGAKVKYPSRWVQWGSACGGEVLRGCYVSCGMHVGGPGRGSRRADRVKSMPRFNRRRLVDNKMAVIGWFYSI